jgi:sec-independent protein translocase protein TatA
MYWFGLFAKEPPEEANMFLFGTVGPQELLLVLLIVIIIFGAKKLPELGKSLGESIRNFKGSVSGKDKDVEKNESKDKTPPPAA